jgi:hypothetical protein
LGGGGDVAFFAEVALVFAGGAVAFLLAPGLPAAGGLVAVVFLLPVLLLGAAAGALAGALLPPFGAGELGGLAGLLPAAAGLAGADVVLLPLLGDGELLGGFGLLGGLLFAGFGLVGGLLFAGLGLLLLVWPCTASTATRTIAAASKRLVVRVLLFLHMLLSLIRRVAPATVMEWLSCCRCAWHSAAILGDNKHVQDFHATNAHRCSASSQGSARCRSPSF